MFWIFFLSFFLFPEIGPEKIYTLKECIDVAISNNQDILLAKGEMELARQRYKEAVSIKYPQLYFDAYYAKHDLVFPVVLIFPHGGFLLPEDRNLSYGAKITLSQILYAGGKIKLVKNQAQLYYKEKESDYYKRLNEIYFDVKKNFYDALYYKKRMQYFKKILKEKNSDSFVIEYKDASLNYEDSIDALKKSMGMEFTSEIEINGEFEVKMEKLDERKLIAKAFEYRPEIESYSVWEKLNELSVRLSYSERRPSLKIISSYDYLADPLNETEKWKRNWELGIVLSLPVFDGFASWSRWQQKKIALKQVRLNKAKVEDDIRYEIRRILRKFNNTVDKYNILKVKSDNYLKLLEVTHENVILWEKLNYLTGSQIAKD